MSRITVARRLRSLCVGGSFKEAKVKRAQCRSFGLQADQSNAIPAEKDVQQAVRPSSSNSTTVNCSLDLDISYPTYMIWGANTGVGKSLVSAGLTASILCPGKEQQKIDKNQRDVFYIKPVQTGYPCDSDSRFVTTEVSRIIKVRIQQDVQRNDVYTREQYLYGSSTVQRALIDSAWKEVRFAYFQIFIALIIVQFLSL
jgi:hypothetical protein